MTGVKKHNIKKPTSIENGTEDYLFSDKSAPSYNKEKPIYRKGIDFLSYNNGENFMAYTPQKAVSLDKNYNLNAVDDSLIDNQLSNSDGSETDYDTNQNTENEWVYDETYNQNTSRSLTAYFIPIFFISVALAWSAFFIISNLNILTPAITFQQISSLIINWATPIILIALSWLLFMRNSTAEALRFGDVSNSLRIEAQNVEDKVREVNQEIALARDFLSQYSQDLEHIGRHTAENIVNASQKIEYALNNSTQKADILEKVSESTHKNLELLSRKLPVVNSAAKDATNLIGKTGMEAIAQVRSLELALKDSNEASTLNLQELEKLSLQNKLVSNDILTQTKELQAFSEAMSDKTKNEIREIAATIKSEYNEFDLAISETSNKLDTQSQEIADNLHQNVERLSLALQDLIDSNHMEDNHINDMIAKIREHIDKSQEKIDVISDKASAQTAKMAFAMTALRENSDSVEQGLSNNHAQAELLIERSEKLLLALDTSSRELDETIPASVKRLDETFDLVEARFKSTFSNIKKLSEHSDKVNKKNSAIEKQLSASKDQIEALLEKQNNEADLNNDKINKILSTLQESKAALEEISNSANGIFAEQIKNVNNQISESLEFSREAISEKIDFSSQRIAENGSTIIQETIDKQVAAIENNLQISLDIHVKAASENVAKLQSQLSVIEEMTDNLEKRLEDNSVGFSNVGEESFSRQMALLTESLNSTAIDVAKIISNDVTDTAWAAYLKGDRGVFTRRAVKLLTASEAKLIVSHYDENMEFRDHVNRYIHDFEAMMRVLLSTRDGNAIGVTILSSDVGKLYVALAQAIERLRH